ncbi:hypothetical protein EW146_g2468 [Bondarzewia mesenterica]|uniref:Uncharacterized protein n=1 Tax=Bondarzewia mesenterica TaxID=1095465 RepID=A0A4S4M0I4_9AGAM|nr:hypothetical protein EW146_g2468 [Bondarzewia mesenterica]
MEKFSETSSTKQDASPVASETTEAKQQPLVMQIVVRRDLLDVGSRSLSRSQSLDYSSLMLQAEGWGVGPLMAQAAHATAAVLHETREHPETVEYLNDLKNMRSATGQLSLLTADVALTLHTLFARSDVLGGNAREISSRTIQCGSSGALPSVDRAARKCADLPGSGAQ